MNKEILPLRKRALFSFLIVCICLMLFLLTYGLTIIVRGFGFYDEMMSSGRGNVGRVYDPDPVIGYVPSPGIYSSDLVPIGPAVALHHDDDGFRAPIWIRRSVSGGRPLILFLGDSFTYGRMVAAENTFAYKTALKLGGDSINGGVNGYGLAQMVLRAKQLIQIGR